MTNTKINAAIEAINAIRAELPSAYAAEAIHKAGELVTCLELAQARAENAALKPKLALVPAPVSSVRFMYNGVKVGKGPLQRAHYSFTKAWTCGTREIPNQIVVYGKNYRRFSPEVSAEFTVQNKSDSQTDYFENDQIRILPNHPRFADAAAAMLKGLEKDIARCDKTGRTEAAKGYRQDVENLNAFLAGVAA